MRELHVLLIGAAALVCVGALVWFISVRQRDGVGRAPRGDAGAETGEPEIDVSARPMEPTRFWNLVSASTAGEDEAVAALTARLRALSNDELGSFQERLSRVLYSLDLERLSAGMERAIGEDASYVSPDDFLYRRCAAVLRGKAHVDALLGGTATLTDDWAEGLLYAAEDVWAERHDDLGVFWQTSVSYESFSNSAGWQTDRATGRPIGLAED